jgi:ABC-2 type transport system permease protein
MKVFLLELRNIRKSLLGWTISVAGVILLILAFFPSMKSGSMRQLAEAKLEGVDPALLAALGFGGVIPDLTVITNYFGYVLQFITLAIMVFVVQKAVNMLIREETEGTIEFLYGKPVSREEIFFQKLLALFAAFAAFLLVLGIVTAAGYLAFSDYGFKETIKDISIMYGGVLYVGVVFLSIGTLFSVLIPSSRSSSAVTISIVFGTFILGVMSVVVDKLDFLLYFSPMDWIKTAKLLSEGIAAEEWAVGISTAVLSVASALYLYTKKDMKV